MKKHFFSERPFAADIIIIIAMAIVIIGIIVTVTNHSHQANIDRYNNGTCTECGGHYAYEEAIGHKYETSYIYVCENCGHRIEIDYLP